MQRTDHTDALEEARYAVAKASYEVKRLLAEIAHKRFDPNQARVPAGNSDGGQWTGEGSSGGRVQVAARVPRVIQPRRREAPANRPVDFGSGPEWLTQAEYVELVSSRIPAESLANVLRNHSPDWKPEAQIVASAADRISANRSAAAEAAARLRKINAALWSDAPTSMILMPRGNPVGYVHGGAGRGIHTMHTRDEFDLLLTRLIIHATPDSHPNYSGQVYLRRDGVKVGIRESGDSGPTIDVLRGDQTISTIKKIHVRSSGKSHFAAYAHYSNTRGIKFMHRNVVQVGFSRLEEPIVALEMNFREYCHSYVTDSGDPHNFSLTLQDLTGLFGSDRKTLETALRYFLTHIIGNGLAPMNWVNATDHEYGPVTKYGVRPQEIIDNIMAAWLAGGDYFVDDFELMFGWEQYCGEFIVDDGPEDDVRGGS